MGNLKCTYVFLFYFFLYPGPKMTIEIANVFGRIQHQDLRFQAEEIMKGKQASVFPPSGYDDCSCCLTCYLGFFSS